MVRFSEERRAVHRLVFLQYVAEVNFRSSDDGANYIMLVVGNAEPLKLTYLVRTVLPEGGFPEIHTEL